jgi:hypothetical protein
MMNDRPYKFLLYLVVLVELVIITSVTLRAETLNWQPNPEREDGASIDAAALTYEVWANNQLVYSGPDTSIEVDLGVGTTCYELYQVADGVRGRSLVKCFQLRAIPPAPPGE